MRCTAHHVGAEVRTLQFSHISTRNWKNGESRKDVCPAVILAPVTSGVSLGTKTFVCYFFCILWVCFNSKLKNSIWFNYKTKVTMDHSSHLDYLGPGSQQKQLIGFSWPLYSENPNFASTMMWQHHAWANCLIKIWKVKPEAGGQ